jgi:hypothetical protein
MYVLTPYSNSSLTAKREAIWEEKVEMERNPEDLGNTRGGALLKSLNKKKRIAKCLPKFENELQNRIKVFFLPLSLVSLLI